jgi:hypothetical protein
MTDDYQTRLERILATRVVIKWPYRVDIATSTFKENSTEISAWRQSPERLGESTIEVSANTKVYFTDQSDWMEFCLRWK